MHRLAFLLPLVAAVAPVAAEVLRVEADGSGDYPTPQAALDAAAPGDTVVLGDGEYPAGVDFVRSGEPGRPITLRAANKHAAKIVSPTAFGVHTAGHSHLRIEDLDITNTFTEPHSGTGVAVIDSHHVEVVGNRVHDCGGNGVEVKVSDVVLIEWNVVFGNSHTSQYQTSGISVYQPQPLGGPGAFVDDGYGIVIRHNHSFANRHTVRTPTGHLSDGNGVIVDNTVGADQMADFGVEGLGVTYGKPILVDSNFCWGNGGSGVSAYLATNTTFRNNSVYGNRQEDTGAAELQVGRSRDVTFVNNAAHARDGGEVVIAYENEGVSFVNNVLHNGPADIDLGPSNVTADPRFVAPERGDLHLMPGSPCVDAGVEDHGAAEVDIDGQPRVAGRLDVGADERQGE